MPTSPVLKELELARIAVRRGQLTGPALVETLLLQGAGQFKRTLFEHLEERGLVTPDLRAELEQLQAARQLGLEEDELEPGLSDEADPRIGKVIFNMRLDVRSERRPFLSRYAGRRAGDPDPVTLTLIETAALRGGLWLDFFETVRSTVNVKSPNVIPVLDAGRAEGCFAILQRHVEGIDLGSLIARVRRVKLSEALRISLEIAKGIRDLHAASLAHRDLRPSIVRLSKKAGEVLVFDAGIAFEPPGSRRLQGPGVYGNPWTMAPEVARGELGDSRSDLYSLGCICYEAVTGTRPFEGFGYADLKPQHLEVDPISPTSVQGDIPPYVSDALLSLLAKKKEDRPSPEDAVPLLEGVLAQVPKTGLTMRMGPGGAGP